MQDSRCLTPGGVEIRQDNISPIGWMGAMVFGWINREVKTCLLKKRKSSKRMYQTGKGTNHLPVEPVQVPEDTMPALRKVTASIRLFTLRDIQIGHEIRYNYGPDDGNMSWSKHRDEVCKQEQPVQHQQGKPGDAVRKNSATAKVTDVEVETRVKEWLKFASERDGGRKQRMERKRCDNQMAARSHDPSHTE